MKKLLLPFFLLAALSSCAHVISPENRENAISGVPLSDLRSHADQYVEKAFIFGGIIADTSSKDDGTEMEVVQMPLDEWGYVASHDKSEGRFIVIAKNHLDPLIFSKGREVTVSGVLIGIRTEKLHKKDYVYPLFRAKEIHLLPRRTYYRDSYYGHEPFYYPYPVYYPYPYYWGIYPFYLTPSFYFQIH